jgi:hypothetical protein
MELYYIILYYIILYYIILCYVMLCYVVLCYVMLCYVMLCYVMLCYVILCYVMLYYIILYYIILYAYCTAVLQFPRPGATRSLLLSDRTLNSAELGNFPPQRGVSVFGRMKSKVFPV